MKSSSMVRGTASLPLETMEWMVDRTARLLEWAGQVEWGSGQASLEVEERDRDTQRPSHTATSDLRPRPRLGAWG